MKSIFITVRSESTRLPNKALLPFDGTRTIEFLIERVKRSKAYDKIVLCTTERSSDDILCELAVKHDIFFHRGSTEDKLLRWRDACRLHKVDFFVTADGDDLFCEPDLIDKAMKQYDDEDDIDFIKSDGIISGAFTYGIKATALEKVCDMKNTDDTEMMWVYFTETGLFKVRELKDINARFYRDDIRMTLDYEEDLRFFENVVEHFRKEGNNSFNLFDIVNLIDSKPEIAKINLHRQFDWKRNQEARTKVILKNI
jgi:spore coat polysaccharide biosynthesis protein SpsF (cytidylyltransferase family)